MYDYTEVTLGLHHTHTYTHTQVTINFLYSFVWIYWSYYMALQKLHIAYVSWVLVVVFFFKK